MEKLVDVQETSQSRYSDRVSIDTNPMVSLYTDARGRADLLVADLSPKIHLTTRLSLADFYLVYMCSVISLDNIHALLIIHSQHTYLGFE